MFSYSVKSLEAKIKQRDRNVNSQPTLVFDFLLDKKHGRVFSFSSAAFMGNLVLLVHRFNDNNSIVCS